MCLKIKMNRWDKVLILSRNFKNLSRGWSQDHYSSTNQYLDQVFGIIWNKRNRLIIKSENLIANRYFQLSDQNKNYFPLISDKIYRHASKSNYGQEDKKPNWTKLKPNTTNNKRENSANWISWTTAKQILAELAHAKNQLEMINSWHILKSIWN